MKVTEAPTIDGFAEETTLAVVAAALVTSDTAPDVLAV